MNELNRNINRIMRTIRRKSAAANHDDELGQGERRTLHFIHHNPGTTQKDICEKFNVNKAATARQCASLENKGYIERRPNENDGRSWLLFPTSKADVLKAELESSEEKIFSWLTEDLDETEIAQLTSITSKICSKIDTDHEHHRHFKERL